jgi:hypothetical protein
MTTLVQETETSKPRHGKSLRVDVVAREIPNRAAVIAGGFGDEGEALELVKDLNFILESDYEIRLRTGATQKREAEAKGDGFIGRPMDSQYPGRCAVCSRGFATGDQILFNGDKPKGQRAAHLRCGDAG